jgi:hypothetical protein
MKPGARAATVAAKAKRWRDADGEHIDVRGLPPPEPLAAILQLVETVEQATAVVVHHDREPKLLYAELAQIGWQAQPLPAPPGEVRLRLARVP